MPFAPRSTCLAVVLALAASAPVRAEVYRLDPVHTRVAFAVDHAGLSKALGTFGGAHGRLEFDPADWSAARVDVAIPLASLDLGDAGWRDALLDGTFLDADDHPHARFASTGVESTGTGSARVTGTLTLRGIARPVVLDVRLNAVKRHPITRRRSIGFSATTTLSRRDFGIDAWPNVIGDAIELRIEAEGVVDADAAAPTDDIPAPEPADDAADPQHR
jgi:polyisoprenoid-binding protein YceI